MKLQLFNKVLFIASIYGTTNLKIHAQSCCSLEGFSKAKVITIDNTGGVNSVTNEAISIEYDTQTRVSYGAMNNGGSDIRFLDSDCSTPLDYFICGNVNTTNTEI